ncbi:hypothetical protein LguiA_016980 [Lonicera macranthoides]
MAKKDRFQDGYCTGFASHYEFEGSGSSGRIDTEVTASEVSSGPSRKSSALNSALCNGFGTRKQVLPLSKLSLPERKDLELRLRAELEQIRDLQKKAEFQRTNVIAVSSSSDVLSFSNGQNGPRAGNIKKSSAGTYGPGKIFNSSSHKGRGWNRGTSGRFESQVAPPSTSNTIVLKQCESLLKKLMSHQYGWAFNTPVDVVKLNLPDYFTVIKHPMDLGTIKRKIANFEYSSPLDFHADVKLTFFNAMTYNPPGNDFHFMADTLGKFFDVRWKVIEKKLSVNKSKPPPKELSLLGEKDIVKPMPPSKKRKITSIEHKVIPEPFRPKMTDEDKNDLGRELEALLGDLPDNIIDFLKEQSSHGKELGDDEIEIDIDDLSEDTLLTLRKLLDEHLQEKQNNAKAEPCEIELLNESGFSNSSMQLHKGSGLVDEDVDIGGNELPVSSYPPAERKKDTGHQSSTYVTAGSSSGSDSGSSDNESHVAKVSIPAKQAREHSDRRAYLDEKAAVGDLVDEEHSAGGLDQLEQISEQNPNSVELDCLQDGESAATERQVSPDKLYRAARLKERFADTILKAREKALNQGEKGELEQLRRERQELELQRKKEKARLQAEAKTMEDARRRVEAEAAAEAKRKRELEREAARQALLEMEKTAEINENSRFLEDLDRLRAIPPEQLHSPVNETSPDKLLDGFGSFKFGASNPLEQLGLYMKVDEEEEGGEPPSISIPKVVNDVEEGEID